MGKKELIQIRVSEEDKQKIKVISIKKGMTVSEFLLYGAMRAISEDEFIKNHYKKIRAYAQIIEFKKGTISFRSMRNSTFLLFVYSF